MKKILLVEDDPFIADIYANCLKKKDFFVDIASDGQIALEKIKNNFPDLIILDIILPKMSGWEILEEMRKNPTTKNIKVIVISNLNEKDYREKISNLKVEKYFLKIKTDPEEIAETAREMFNS